MSYHKVSKSYASFVSQLSSISIPSNIQEALADPRWTEAMVDEMTALEKKQHLGSCVLSRSFLFLTKAFDRFYRIFG